MHPNNALVTFAQEGSHIFAWISASSGPPAASAQHYRYNYIRTALQQRGLKCTVEWGLSDYIVHAELPDDSSLIISPPQEPASEHPEAPESWMVTRHRSAEPAVYEVVYDSEPDGPDFRHGGSVPDLLDAVEARLDWLGVRRQEQERSAEERAAGAVLYRAGFVPDMAPGGVHAYRLPLFMTDPAEQRLVVTRAFDMLQAEGFNLAGDPDLLDPELLPDQLDTSVGDRLGHLAQTVWAARHTSEVAAPLTELTAPGSGVLQRAAEILDATADWWEGFDDTADHRHVKHLRLIAKRLDSHAIRLQAIRNELADHHAVHPDHARAEAERTFPQAAASSRVNAALAPSPSAGQQAVPAGLPTEPSAHAAPSSARPPSAPGR
ncbi:hypothetical protein ACIPWL_28280 [Streptomyces sp. NPDC090023]|uniref:hypothetical protein n=1 Tax=unclassified Streptomyces TaxID=2593676 RepID=UPI00381054AF